MTIRQCLVPVLLAAALIAGLIAVPASASALSKPEARSKSNAKVRTFLARSSWAQRARIGRCRHKAKHRVVCFGAVRGESRTCRVRIVVAGKRKRAKLRRRKCHAQPLRAARIVRLSAWLGSPAREPLDPFRVTYPHGASATSQLASLGGEPAPEPTPPGVLALYVDGILECAENVNIANPDATCPVDYDALGTHKVTTIYTSGSESAADTMVHDVEPLATETALDLGYADLPGGSEALEDGTRCNWTSGCDYSCHFVGSGGPGEEECHFTQEWRLGTLTISAGSVPAGAVSLQCSGTCIAVPHTLEGNATASILMHAQGSGRRFPVGNSTPPSCEWMKEHADAWRADLTRIELTATSTASGYVRSAITRALAFSPSLPC